MRKVTHRIINDSRDTIREFDLRAGYVPFVLVWQGRTYVFHSMDGATAQYWETNNLTIADDEGWSP